MQPLLGLVRRYAFLLLFGVTLVFPFLLRVWLIPADASSAQARLSLTIITPHTQDIRRTFERAFSAWHAQRFGEPVRLHYLTPQGTSDMVRQLHDIYGARGVQRGSPRPAEASLHVDIDLVWGGGDVIFERELKPYLKPLTLPAGLLQQAFPERDLAGVALYEHAAADAAATGSAPRWVGVALSSFGIVYNRQLYAALRLPEPSTWSDLTRSELGGWVALADPTRSGSAAVTYLLVIQRAMADAEEALPAQAEPAQRALALEAGFARGLQQLTRIAANARYFTDSAGRPCDDVGQAEAAAGMAIDFYARVMEDQVGSQRIQYVAPQGATAITPDPIAVLLGTVGEQEVLANRFVEFLLSIEGQRLWNVRSSGSRFVERSLRRLPVRRDVYADRTHWADNVNPFESSGNFNLRQRWLGLFRDLRDVWAAAWIDNQGELLHTARRLRAVPDASLRESLLDELASLPITMAEITQHKLERERREQQRLEGQDARLFVAQQRVRWAQRFREHYAQVLTQAEHRAEAAARGAVQGAGP